MLKGIRKYLHENQEMIAMGLACMNGAHIRTVDFQRMVRQLIFE